MVRQAHTYLVGAVSSVTLVSIAIAAFVFLVSAQVFKDWPIDALGGGDNHAAVSDASAVGGAGEPSVAAGKTVVPGTAKSAAPTTATAGRTAGDSSGGPAGGARADTTQPGVGASEIPSTGSEPVATAPATPGNGPGNTGSPGSEADSGSNQGAASNPGSASNPATSGSSGGGSTSSGSGAKGSSGGGSSTPSVPSVPSTPAPPPVKVPSTSTAVTETVNGTVNTVDETVTGGALKETGVTELTESVVNGVAGPESVVGKTVDGVGEVVGGLLGGNK